MMCQKIFSCLCSEKLCDYFSRAKNPSVLKDFYHSDFTTFVFLKLLMFHFLCTRAATFKLFCNPAATDELHMYLYMPQTQHLNSVATG